MNPFIADVLASMGAFFRAPFQDLSLLWQLIPIILIWVLMEWYFGMYKHEKLGWNTAVGNGVTLFWTGVTSMQHIFSNNYLFTWQRFGILLFGILYALFIIYISFRHKIGQQYTFLLASPTPIYYISFVVILYAHDMLVFDRSMFVALILLFGFFFVVDRLLHKFLPEAKDDAEEDSFSNSSFFDNSMGAGANTGLTKDFSDPLSSIGSQNDFSNNVTSGLPAKDFKF